MGVANCFAAIEFERLRMTPAELRAALATTCDLVDGVWVARERKDVVYADGGEAHVAATIAACHRHRHRFARARARASTTGPRNTTSRPRGRTCCDPWPSPRTSRSSRSARAAARSPDTSARHCGTVLALEGSLARARIAASRCRDLDNVVVACGEFPGFALASVFDLVTLVGVLEYSRVYVEGADPVQAVLDAARARVAPGGRLVVAIENQLGVKYLAGSPEDHLGMPFAGVTGEYGGEVAGHVRARRASRAPRGRGLRLASSSSIPSPTTSCPRRSSPRRRSITAGSTPRTSSRRPRTRTASASPRQRAYSESLARDVFVRNGLGPDTANSFLAIAGDRASAPRRCARLGLLRRARPALCVRDALRGEPQRDRGGASPALRRGARDAAHRCARDAAATSRARCCIAASSACSPARAGPSRSSPSGPRRGSTSSSARHRENRGRTRDGPGFRGFAALAGPRASGRALRLPPFNVVRGDDGTLAAFDLEWRAPGVDRVTLAHVVFRGLYTGSFACRRDRARAGRLDRHRLARLRRDRAAGPCRPPGEDPRVDRGRLPDHRA